MPRRGGRRLARFGAIRAARANIRQHMKYTDWLAGTRNWLAGDRLTYADLAAAATLSVLDYLGEVDWTRTYRGARMVHAGEVAAVVPAAARPTGCAACRRCRIMRTSISSNGTPARADRPRGAARRLRRRRRHHARRDPAGAGAARRVRRRRPSRLDGLDRRDAGAPRRTRGAVARGPLDRHARHELRAGPRSARALLAKRDRGAISVYARNRDYHDVIKGRLKELAGKLAARDAAATSRCSSTPRR